MAVEANTHPYTHTVASEANIYTCTIIQSLVVLKHTHIHMHTVTREASVGLVLRKIDGEQINSFPELYPHSAISGEQNLRLVELIIIYEKNYIRI